MRHFGPDFGSGSMLIFTVSCPSSPPRADNLFHMSLPGNGVVSTQKLVLDLTSQNEWIEHVTHPIS